jgi:hypothetical protein
LTLRESTAFGAPCQDTERERHYRISTSREINML